MHKLNAQHYNPCSTFYNHRTDITGIIFFEHDTYDAVLIASKDGLNVNRDGNSKSKHRAWGDNGGNADSI